MCGKGAVRCPQWPPGKTRTTEEQFLTTRKWVQPFKVELDGGAPPWRRGKRWHGDGMAVMLCMEPGCAPPLCTAVGRRCLLPGMDFGGGEAIKLSDYEYYVNACVQHTLFLILSSIDFEPNIF
jgi:hypothetical protein